MPCTAAADGRRRVHALSAALTAAGAAADRTAERAELVALLAAVPGRAALDGVLLQLDPAREPEVVVWRAIQDALALRSADPATVRRLVDAAVEPDVAPTVRALRLEALGGVAHPAAGLRLLHGRAGETWVEAACRARALAARPSRARLEALVGLLGHEAGAVRRSAWEGLVRVTGLDLPADAAAWAAGLAARDAAGAGEEAGAEGAGGEGRYARAVPPHVPHYYGIPIPRPRSAAVFCLDVSQSMYGRGIEQARAHLTNTLHDLPTTHRFAIVAFHTRIETYVDDLVVAHPVHKARAVAWLDGLETTAYTNMIDALEWAYGLAGRGPRARTPAQVLDAVFLLSDGAPNRGRVQDATRLAEVVRALARDDVPLHTIGAGEEVFPLLRALAAAGGGRFVDAFE